MRLSKTYSNNPIVFEEVRFNSGLNVILAEAHLPDNKEKDTHNLGKSTFGKLLNFCFLKELNNDFFLVKHDVFSGFVFYLEVQIHENMYLTIRRSVTENTKISFKKHENSDQNYSGLPDEDWDQRDIPFSKARILLDGYLDLAALTPWTFRNVLGYLLRSQDNYDDIFKLSKFLSRHADWKPVTAHVLGFNSTLIKSHYDLESSIQKNNGQIHTLEVELGDNASVRNISKIEGLISIKERELNKKQAQIDSLDFRQVDKDAIKNLVGVLDREIAELNSTRYSLSKRHGKLTASLKEKEILFDINATEQLFKEANILFPGQLKHDFEQLIIFNKAITDERISYLKQEENDLTEKIREIASIINAKSKKRIAALNFIKETDVLTKYKDVGDEISSLKADIIDLSRRRDYLNHIQTLKIQIRELDEKKKAIGDEIQKDVHLQNTTSDSLFSTIRIAFNDIVKNVLSRNALLAVTINQLGHLEFSVDILDEYDKITGEVEGHTYKKLLCIAFDMAMIYAHKSLKFPHFVYHDGVFETLDDRKKEQLLKAIRNYADEGLQQIITVIDSDIKSLERARAIGKQDIYSDISDELENEVNQDEKRDLANESVFSNNEIIVRLHDDGLRGRLFKTSAW